MALPKILGRLCAAAVAVCVWTGCKGDAAKSGADLEKRCEQLAKACGDKDKHIEKITEECKLSSIKYEEKGCAPQATALYDCFEKDLCGAKDKVWTLDDLRVLAERKKKCVAEAKASIDCLAK